MVEDTGLEPVISLLAKQVQLPLCQSPSKLDAFYIAVAFAISLRLTVLYETAGLEPTYAEA